jgi:hypothetical protein
VQLGLEEEAARLGDRAGARALRVGEYQPGAGDAGDQPAVLEEEQRVRGRRELQRRRR